jgi:hypothetical protein
LIDVSVFAGAGRGRIYRLTGLAAAISSLFLGGLLIVLLLEDRVDKESVWRVRLAFLVGLEVAYGAVLAATLIMIPVLGFVFVRARQSTQARPWVARGLLLATSLLLALVCAEAAAAFWRRGLERSGVLAIPGRDAPGVSKTAAEFPATAEVVLPHEFPEPPDGAVNLVVLGESSAEGVPFNLFGVSVGTLVARRLEQAIPGRRVRLEVLASSGETLERQHRKLATLRRRPDALIVYCGHNEFSARLPWSREVAYYVDAGLPSTWEWFVAGVESFSPVCGLIRRGVETCRIAIPPPRGGDRVLADSPACTRAEYDLLLTDFRRRLERIVASAEQIGAIPILIVPPANDSGLEPNRSFLSAGTKRAERARFERAFRAVRRLEPSDPVQAIAGYRSLLARQPGFAEAHFRLARLLERTGTGAWDEVYRHDVSARDCDGLPFRLPTAFQDVYREVASRHRCILIDSQAYFHAIGRHGLLDDRLFIDAMHPSLRGQIALAQAVLQGLHARRAFGWPEGTAAPVLDPAECAAHSGLGPKAWEKICLWGAMVYDLLAKVPYDPSERLARRDAYQAAFVRISQGEAPGAVGLPNVGIPEAVPLQPDAAILTFQSEVPGTALKSGGPSGHDEATRP